MESDQEKTNTCHWWFCWGPKPKRFIPAFPTYRASKLLCPKTGRQVWGGCNLLVRFLSFFHFSQGHGQDLRHTPGTPPNLFLCISPGLPFRKPQTQHAPPLQFAPHAPGQPPREHNTSSDQTAPPEMSATTRSHKPSGRLLFEPICLWVKIQIVPSLNIPIRTKIGSKMGAAPAKMGSHWF